MPFVQGFLKIRSGGHPDHELPGGEGPIDPGFGGGIGAPPDPGFGIPVAPPGVWPPPSGTLPIVPAPPGTPPGVIWPRPPGIDNTLPGGGLHPGGGPMPGGERPGNALPTPPPGGGGTLPVQRVFWMLAYCPALGWNFVTVDPSLQPTPPIAATPAPKG